MFILYQILIKSYGLIISLSSLWNPSAKAWKNGRANNINSLIRWRSQLSDEVFWMHVASHGEFEQGIQLIKKIKIEKPHYKIALTFFSPSGFNAVRNHTDIDWIGYIPLDTRSQMTNFIDILNPSIAVFVKNEWWWNCLDILAKRKIPFHNISSTIRKNHYFIKYKFEFIKSIINSFESIGVVDQESLQNLKTVFPQLRSYRAGDMRVDRVAKLKEKESDNLISNLIKGRECIIYGSVWPSDLPAIKSIIEAYPKHKHLLFPHIIENGNVNKLLSKLHNATVFNKYAGQNTVIYNKMGILATSYRHASFVYIGGGYSKGIHNILEAAIYDKPILIGPNHYKSSEANILSKSKAVTSLSKNPSKNEIPTYDVDTLKEIQLEYKFFFEKHLGATNVIFDNIFKDLSLNNEQ